MQPRTVNGMTTETERVEQTTEYLRQARATIAQEQERARSAMARWQDGWRRVMLERVTTVRVAHAAGLSKLEISQRMGIARSTVYADLSDAPEGAAR